MQTTYDPKTDRLTLRLGSAPAVERHEGDGVALECDVEGNVVQFEILDASSRVDGLR